jgi:hypothetical protein
VRSHTPVDTTKLSMVLIGSQLYTYGGITPFGTGVNDTYLKSLSIQGQLQIGAAQPVWQLNNYPVYEIILREFGL